ncbi:hypothetical protein HZB01_03625 [Candidatus Woesearchaeota archaeon]|nr:hypothetical protein [Candidatus Woesearchaeota archaeon]
MKKKLIFLFLLVMLPVAHALSYSVVLHYDTEKFTLQDAAVVSAAPSPSSAGNRYTVRMLSFKEKVLFDTSFNLNADAVYSMPLDKSTLAAKNAAQRKTVNLLLPYYPHAKSLEIAKEGEVLLLVDLSRFSTCNENGVCDSSESQSACPQDCTCGNKICEPTENYMLCSADCPPEQQKPESKLALSPTVLWLIGGFALLLFCCTVFWFIRQKNINKQGKR